MESSFDRQYNLITEYRCRTPVSEMLVYIYTRPVARIEQKHSEQGQIVRKLRSINKNQLIVFYENKIAAFDEITQWSNIKQCKPSDIEHRAIELSNPQERALLERLLKREMLVGANPRVYEASGYDSVQELKPVWSNRIVNIYRAYNINVVVNESGEVVVGIDMTHRFVAAGSIEHDIAAGRIKEGCEVKDIFCGKAYFYDGPGELTISDRIPELSASIVDYYKNLGESYKLKNIPEDTKIVFVRSKVDNTKLSYCPSMLHKVIRLADLPSDGKMVAKLEADVKIKLILETLVKISAAAPHMRMAKDYRAHENLLKHAILVENNGYSAMDFDAPTLLFGSQTIYEPSGGSILSALTRHGLYSISKTQQPKSIPVRYFIDTNIIEDKDKMASLTSIVDDIERQSHEMGATIERIKISKTFDYSSVNVSDNVSFQSFLVSQKESGTFKSPTIFMFSSSNMDEEHYAIVKKVLGGAGGITTQCVNFDKLAASLSKINKWAYNAYIANILLGIYAKSGVQAWVLKDKTHSDCFVGLDVSRELSVNKSAVVQVFGKDGAVIGSKVISASQGGEIIQADTLKDTLINAVSIYENRFGTKPKHITFHRDGRCMENLDALEAVANSLDVKFDYVEITKNFNRRIASFVNKVWQTIAGRVYFKDDFAIMCTTKPFKKIGMAQPIKIRVVASEAHKPTLSLQELAEDVWKLSFMHVHSIQKTRLPITTYYADLCSTYGVRDWIPGDMGDLLFYV